MTPAPLAKETKAPKKCARLIGSLKEVSAASWDACADPGGDQPFSSHAFLLSLEESGSATAQTGWTPCHLLLEDEAENLLGCMPLYLKTHSQGEYVFDHGWADALERAGVPYYPKLQSAIPFTPVSGRRLLTSSRKGEAREFLLAAAMEALNKFRVSSLHITFALEEEAMMMKKRGFLMRVGQQYHWRNRGYRDFDGFLHSLTARRRKAIRKERAAVQDSDLKIALLSGDDLTEAVWDAFFAFYMDTGSRKWGRPYLTRSFFSLLGERMGDRVLLAMASRGGRYVAGALHMLSSQALYGRYWGCAEYHRFLHFELCYYQAIDYAIAQGLSRVEAGAQGAHKIERGYESERVWSAHVLAHSGLRAAVADYLRHERRAMEEEIAMVKRATPFRKSGSERL